MLPSATMAAAAHAAARAARAAWPGAGALVLLILLPTLVAGTVFLGGGSGDGALPWLGAGAVATLALALALGASVPVLPRPAVGLVAAVLGLAVWSGASVAWSVAPDRSWDFLNRELVYAAFLLLGVLAAAALGPRAARAATGALAAVLGATLVWALATKAVPALFPDGARAARLRSPIGYWNALALAADMALPLGLWLALSAGRRVLRTGGALLGYAAVLVVLLATSRTGVVAGLVAVALWLWLSRDRVRGTLLALAAVAPACAVAGWAFTRPALVDDGQAYSDRVADGAWLALLALFGGAVVAAAVEALARLDLDTGRRRLVGRALAATAAGLAVLALVALSVRVGNPVTWAFDQFAGTARGEVVNTPDRLTSLSSNNRRALWEEAWHVFEAHPAAGAGAGSFEVARKRYRVDGLDTSEPHSLPLQKLADGGVVGLALLLAAIGFASVGVRAGVRRLDGEERAAAAALAVLPAVFLVHSLADYDWDFLAVTAPTLAALGVLVGAGLPQRPAPTGARVATALVAAAVIVSLGAPWLAARRVHEVLPALERRDLVAARDAAEAARSLDPLSLAPVFARARVEEARGDRSAALHAYADAVRLQRENPDPWYELGLFELTVLGHHCSAYKHLNHAYTLDPASRRWTEGGPLDEARDAVNDGACEP
jgi:hypothetical protein